MSTVAEAVEAIRDGRFVVVVDDADRENEADLILAAEMATPENIAFMVRHTRKSDLELFMEMADVESYEDEQEVPFRMLVPAYIISELKTAFIMGFCIYVPFVLIDLLVSTILMSLGMMMMPPVVVSAPIQPCVGLVLCLGVDQNLAVSPGHAQTPIDQPAWCGR